MWKLALKYIKEYLQLPPTSADTATAHMKTNKPPNKADPTIFFNCGKIVVVTPSGDISVVY